MHVEALLPLGKTDPGLRRAGAALDIGRVGEDARLVEALGDDGLVAEETKDDPYVVMALDAQATTRLGQATVVAMAFPRSRAAPPSPRCRPGPSRSSPAGASPWAWAPRCAATSSGATGSAEGPPAPGCASTSGPSAPSGTAGSAERPLDVRGAHYRLTLMVPLFNPGPIDHPRIPIHLAAMNRVMCRVAGEMADGVRPHPVCTPAHIRQVMLPAVAEGARRAGRDPTAIAVAMKPLVATAPDAAALAARVADVRARVAFYASMPAYRAAFAARGPGDLADGLAALSREQRWEQMPGRISDEVLHCYATVGTHDEIAQRLAERYGGPVDRIEFSIPAGSPAEQERLAALVRDLRRA